MNKQLQQYELVDKKKLKKLMDSEKISENYQLMETKNHSLEHQLKSLQIN